MSTFDLPIYYGIYYCHKDNFYLVDIQDKKENDAIASVLYRNSTLGIWRKGENSRTYYSQQRKVVLTYTNWDPNDDRMSHGDWTAVKMMAASGKWRASYQWSMEYYICEDDHISATGINITEGNKININYDSMVSFRGHTYYIYKAERDLATTRQICHFDNNGYVFIPNDGIENCAIHEIVYASSFVGIINNNHGKFITEKGYEASYLPWASLNQIDKECVARSYINGELYTMDCSLGNHIICESDVVVQGATPKDCSYENRHHYFSQIFYFQNNSFYVFDFLSSRDEALKICARRNAILYAPFNAEENCAVFENVEFDIGINYGSVYLEHVLMRGDNSKSNFTNWADTYPRNPQTYGCVYSKYASGKWINDKCYDTRFICYTNDDDYNYSTIGCEKKFFHYKNQTFSKQINGKIYSFLGRPLSYHDANRICTQFELSLIQTTSNYIIAELNKEIKNQRFFVDYRIFWNDTTLTWLDGIPHNPPWAPNEPYFNDDGIACITAAQNGSFIVTKCHEPHIAVCVGYHSPSFAKSLSGPSKKSVALGVGIFFGLGGAIAIAIIGYYILKRKQISSQNIMSSFGSFKKSRKSALSE